jgi:hypothetical protein
MRIQYRHLLGAKRRNLLRLARFVGLRGVSSWRKASIADAIHATVNP